MKNRIIKQLKEYRFNSVLFLNFLKIFSVMSIIFILIIIFVYNYTSNKIHTDMVKHNENMMYRYADIAEVIFHNIEYLLVNISIDNDVNIFLKFSEKDIMNTNIKSEISQKIFSYKSISEYVHSIYVYSERNDTICSTDTSYKTDKFYDTEWLDKYNNDKNNTIVYPRKYRNNYPYIITFIRKIPNFGAVIINIDIDDFKGAMKNVLVDSTKFYIVTNEDSIAYNSNTKLFLTKVNDAVLKAALENPGNRIISINGQKYATGYVQSKYYNWRYCTITDGNSYSQQYQLLIHVIIILSGLLIFLGMIISYMFALLSFKPILNITDIIDLEDKKTVDTLRDNEIKHVATKIIKILNDNSELKNELNKRLENAEKYQVLALQSQINPHFLNNTLSSIYYDIVITHGKNDRIAQRIMLFVKLIHYCSVKDELLVSLDNELRFVDSYIEVMKLRYGNFEYERDIPDQFKNVKIIRLSLQPIIENAIYHGISSMNEQGIVKISAYTEENYFCISIWDNGDGIDKDKIKTIKESFLDESFNDKSIGIKNIFKRMKILFGNNADIDIKSEKGKFTCITLKFPLSN